MTEPTATPLEPKAPALPQRFRELLAEQGFCPCTDDESPGSVWFRFEGLRYVTRFALRDESRDELSLLRAPNVEQSSNKVVKIYVSPECDVVEFGTEIFLDGCMPSFGLLERLLWTLRGRSRDSFDPIRHDEPKAKA